MNNPKVGTMTLFNVTPEPLIVHVNATDEPHRLPAVERRGVMLVETVPSPLPEDGQVAYGVHPNGRTFLRSTNAQANYFHQGPNRVRVQRPDGSDVRTYDFDLSQGATHSVEGAGTVVISQNMFVITSSTGESRVIDALQSASSEHELL